MSEWRTTRLEVLCERVTVGFVGKMADQYVADGIPFLRSQNIQPFHVERDGLLEIGDVFHDRIKKSALREGDVAVVRTGYPGTAAVVPADLDGSNCADLVIITPSKDLNPHFLAALFNSTWGAAHVSGQLVGSAQQHFNVGSAKAMEVRLPNRGEQDRIADVLCSMTDLIDNNRQRIEILEEMARLLYREWFVHFRFPGHEDVDLVDSELGLIPDGWAVTSLVEQCSHVKRNVKPHDSPAEEFLHYSIPAFDASRLPVSEPGEDIKSGKYQMIEDCVLVSKLNPRFPRVWRVDPVGAVRSICSTEFLVLEESEGGWPLNFVQGLVAGTDFGQRLAQMADGTSTSHQRVKPGDLMALPVIGPPTSLVRMYSDQVEPMLKLVSNLTEQNRVLRVARDLLLPRLVSGELDVSSLDLSGVVG